MCPQFRECLVLRLIISYIFLKELPGQSEDPYIAEVNKLNFVEPRGYV